VDVEAEWAVLSNALEVSAPGTTIRVTAGRAEGQIALQVHTGSEEVGDND